MVMTARSETATAEKLRILDRKALVSDMARLTDAAHTPTEARAAVLDRLKLALAEGRADIRKRFEAGATGAFAVAANSHLMDQIVRTIYDYATLTAYPMAYPSACERISVVAVGGYGRGELAPLSVVDLLFLLP